MAAAAIDMRAGKVFVRSVHETVGGAHIIQDDPVTLDPADYRGIGAAVQKALLSFRIDVPMPSASSFDLDAPNALCVAAGVRNWREFAREAKCVSVLLEDGRITLTPWKNDAPRPGFVPLKGRDQVMSDTSSGAELGGAVIAAFADAE